MYANIKTGLNKTLVFNHDQGPAHSKRQQYTQTYTVPYLLHIFRILVCLVHSWTLVQQQARQTKIRENTE